ncbi:MAG: BON domain-containing protein [Bacillota bacterium]
MKINVDAYRGVVPLSGFVDNQKQASDAVTAAKQVAAVDKVINNPEVKPRESSGRRSGALRAWRRRHHLAQVILSESIDCVNFSPLRNCGSRVPGVSVAV